MPERHDDTDLARFASLIDAWAANALDELEALDDVQDDPIERLWYLRMHGDDKKVITVWLRLRERTLHHETYFLPHPEENQAEVMAYLLRANARLYGMAFCIGDEDALYLRGQTPLDHLDETELDRILGSCWEWSERYFLTALHLAFASKFK